MAVRRRLWGQAAKRPAGTRAAGPLVAELILGLCRATSEGRVDAVFAIQPLRLIRGWRPLALSGRAMPRCENWIISIRRCAMSERPQDKWRPAFSRSCAPSLHARPRRRTISTLVRHEKGTISYAYSFGCQYTASICPPIIVICSCRADRSMLRSSRAGCNGSAVSTADLSVRVSQQTSRPN